MTIGSGLGVAAMWVAIAALVIVARAKLSPTSIGTIVFLGAVATVAIASAH